jgi:hypothetical protein
LVVKNSEISTENNSISNEQKEILNLETTISSGVCDKCERAFDEENHELQKKNATIKIAELRLSIDNHTNEIVKIKTLITQIENFIGVYGKIVESALLKNITYFVANPQTDNDTISYVSEIVSLNSQKIDISSLVYDALQPLQKWISEIIVVIGGLYKNKLSLEKQIDQSSIPTRLYQNTDKMPELMSKCDIALNSGGLTCWEFGCLGVLNIILPHSKREMLSAEYMDKYNYGYTISVKPNKNIKEAIENILKDNFFERIVRLKKAISVDGVDKLVKKILQ